MHTVFPSFGTFCQPEVSSVLIPAWNAIDMKDHNIESNILKRAHEIVNGYRLLIEPSRTGGFLGRSIELPRSYARGKTDVECLTNLRAVLVDVVAALLKANKIPPRPAEKKLTEQVNIRLAPEEKLVAEQLAQSAGCRGLADYIRQLLMKQLRI